MVSQMSLKLAIPFVHAIDLERVGFLARALGQVALCPLTVTGCDLLDANDWVLTVVSIEVVVSKSAFSLRTTMGELVLVVEAASLLATGEGALHTRSVVGELFDPAIL